MQQLILLCGRKKTGKGQIFTFMQKYVKSMGEFAFATPIKKFCIEGLGLTHDQMYGTSAERESPTHYKWANVAEHIRQKYKKQAEQLMTAREVIQVVGTDVMRRNFDTNVWAKGGVLAALKSEFTFCNFTDVRMKNEISTAQELSKATGQRSPLVIRVYRESGLEDAHESELDLDDYDVVPNQRSVKQGVPPGFKPLRDVESPSLYYKPNGVEHPFDYILDNNGSLETLETNIEILVDIEGLTA